MTGTTASSLRRAAGFLLLTFCLSWGFGWFIAYLSIQAQGNGDGLPPVGMLVPAGVALFLQLFVFKHSPIHQSRYRDSPRIVLLGFLVLLGLEAALAVGGALLPGVAPAARMGGHWLMISWTLLVILSYKRCGEARFHQAGIGLGDVSFGTRMILATAAFVLLQTGLNAAFGLAPLQPLPSRVAGVAVPTSIAPAVLLIKYLHAAVEIPLEGLALYFGEEYGWRRYLQQHLECLGRLPAAALIGFIWALWHLPILASGVHTYPLTAAGVVLASSFFTLWGVVQSFAVWRSNSIWLPAFLHGLVNSTHHFLISNVARPEQPLGAFGLGFWGVISLAVVVFLVGRHPLWRRHPWSRERT